MSTYKFKSKGPLRVKLFDGSVMLPSFDITNCREVAAYSPPPTGHRWVATFPKCGTTWTQMIIALLYRDGAEPPHSAFGSGYFNQTFIELSGTAPEVIAGRDGIPPLAFKSHLPFELQPRNRAGTGRFLVVVRNPKDCAVSWYHHLQRLEFEYELDWNEFFEAFLGGQSGYRDYFDHLVSWWRAAQDPRTGSQITFLVYEEMKADPRRAVEQIAAFMGPDYEDKLKTDLNMIERIVKYSSFEYMKNFNDPNAAIQDPKDQPTTRPPLSKGMQRILAAWEELRNVSRSEGIELGVVESDGHIFFRKGQVNDWTNYFSPEQNGRISEKFKHYAELFGIDKIWKDLSWL